MKAKTSILLLALPALLLASCGGNDENPRGLPTTNQGVVDSLKGQAGLAFVNQLMLREGADQSNTLESGSQINFLTEWVVSAWDPASKQQVDLPVAIDWAVAETEDWKLSENPSMNTIYASPIALDVETKGTFTGTVSYAGATATLTYNVTVEAGEGLHVYSDVKGLFDDYTAGALKAASPVQVTGYVTAHSPDNRRVFLQSGEYAVQVYQATGWADLYDLGNLLTVTGEFTFYGGIEVQYVSNVVEAPAGTECPEVVTSTVDEAALLAARTQGTRWDNALVEATGELVSASIDSEDNEGTFEFKLSTGGTYYVFTSKYVADGARNEVHTLLNNPANVGKTYKVKGISQVYLPDGDDPMFEILPYMQGWIEEVL